MWAAGQSPILSSVRLPCTGSGRKQSRTQKDGSGLDSSKTEGRPAALLPGPEHWGQQRSGEGATSGTERAR